MREAIQGDVHDKDIQKAEDDFKIKIESTWHVALQKLPIIYGFDFAGTRTNIEAWLELKNRNFTVGTYDDTMINLNKWMKAKELRDTTKISTYLCIRFEDIDVYTKLTDYTPMEIKWGARTKQTRDWQDIGPAVHIPISEFTQF
tara:strand:+ start:57 stop:488 length:432 start_codon:yes stop_codon:yes gene_type:complete